MRSPFTRSSTELRAVMNITGVPLGRMYSISSKPLYFGSITSSSTRSNISFSSMSAACAPS